MCTECYFLSQALDEAKDSGAVMKTAEKMGCDGQCTLENGCILYKSMRDTSETDFLQKLKSELLYHMLGE